MMRLSRRSVLAGMAAAPVAAALPVSAAIDPAALEPQFVITGNTTVIPPKSPKDWKWWYGDGELYHPADSREDAIEQAQDYGYTSVCEAYQAQFDVSISVDQLLENWCDRNGELTGDGERCLCSAIDNEALADLETILNSAVRAWVQEHKIDLTAWSFAESRNQMDIPHD